MKWYWYIEQPNEILIDIDTRKGASISNTMLRLIINEYKEKVGDGPLVSIAKQGRAGEEMALKLEELLAQDAPAVKLILMRRRLLGAINDGKLDVKKAYILSSVTAKHYHVAIILNYSMPYDYRSIIASRLVDDQYRNQMNRMRIRHGRLTGDTIAASLLISPTDYRELGFRAPDHTCDCPSKHTDKVMASCPIAYQLRGEHVSDDYLGKPVDSRKPFKLGEMDLTP